MRIRDLLPILLAAAAWTGAGAQGTGSISGRVTYGGRVPEPVYVFESGQKQAIIALDPEKGLGGAVVSIDAPRDEPPAAPEVVINQRNWWFTPLVVAVVAGQPVRFTNDDPSNHNVRSSTGAPANRFSAFTGSGEPYVHRFRANPDGSPSVITCDIHAWMTAWVYAFDHRHFSQTDRSGRFTLAGVPAGKYRLTVRHAPAGLLRTVDVPVSAGQDSRVDVTFDTADLNLPGR